jgi:hypothetical protein
MLQVGATGTEEEEEEEEEEGAIKQPLGKTPVLLISSSATET